MTFGILGSGSWGTALAKILTDNGHTIYWWNRSEAAIAQFKSRGRNPQYIPSARFNIEQLNLSANLQEVIQNVGVLIVAIPSAYTLDVLDSLPPDIFTGKKIVSAIKGIIPKKNLLLNDYLKQKFNVELIDYFAVLGPCHAEEVAQEKLSYLTFAGIDSLLTNAIAECFKNSYINIIINKDIFGVQYAAVLKNIYAVAAGIAHGLDYGDNFLSVLIANSADEMAGFLRKAGIMNAEVGYIDHKKIVETDQLHSNYAASVYLGDLLVTCYSLHSRNRTFGNMIGKGYSVKAAQLEMRMVAEGYYASQCIHHINKAIHADIPIAAAVYDILWKGISPRNGFEKVEADLV